MELCRNILDNKEEYAYFTEEFTEEMVRTCWAFDIWYYGDERDYMAVSEGAKRIYPDNRDEFVQRTGELIGRDINEIL